MDLEGLKKCHDDARAGLYAVTIACYTKYLAAEGRLAEYRALLRELTAGHQAAAITACPQCHPRHAEAVGEWTAAWHLFSHSPWLRVQLQRNGREKHSSW